MLTQGSECCSPLCLKLWAEVFTCQLFLGESEVTGETNFMAYHSLEHSYNRYCGKKVKDSLSSFLPNLPGMIDVPGTQDNR